MVTWTSGSRPLSPSDAVGDSGCWHLAALVRPDGTSEPDVHLTVTDGVVVAIDPCADEECGLAADLVALPPLLNGHDHGRGAGTVADGIADGPLEEWLTRLAVDPPPTQHDLVGRAARAMLASGFGAAVFCVNVQGDDAAAEVREATEAAVAAGLRAAVVFPIADLARRRHGRARTEEGWDAGRRAAELAAFERIAADYAQVSTVELQLGPVGPQWVSESTLRAVAEHAAVHGRRIHMHLLESVVQRRWADDTYPEGLLPWLDGAGLLHEGVWFAHGTQLRDDELALLADRGAGLTLNASSNLRLASGIAPVDRADRSVPRLGAGLDGLALDDDHDGWREVRLLRGIWQAQTHRAVPGKRVLALAAGRGAAAFGRAAPGPVAVGTRLDVQLVDLEGLRHVLARDDWTAADVAVAAATPRRVAEVWVDGRRVAGTRHTDPDDLGRDQRDPTEGAR